MTISLATGRCTFHQKREQKSSPVHISCITPTLRSRGRFSSRFMFRFSSWLRVRPQILTSSNPSCVTRTPMQSYTKSCELIFTSTLPGCDHLLMSRYVLSCSLILMPIQAYQCSHLQSYSVMLALYSITISQTHPVAL